MGKGRAAFGAAGLDACTGHKAKLRDCRSLANLPQKRSDRRAHVRHIQPPPLRRRGEGARVGRGALASRKASACEAGFAARFPAEAAIAGRSEAQSCGGLCIGEARGQQQGRRAGRGRPADLADGSGGREKRKVHTLPFRGFARNGAAHAVCAWREIHETPCHFTPFHALFKPFHAHTV